MKTVELKGSAGKTKGSGVLSLQGNLTLDHVEQVLKFVREAVGKYTDLRVEVREVVGIDLGFLQVLHALHAHQRERGCDLQVQLTVEPEVAALLRNTGFAHWIAQ